MTCVMAAVALERSSARTEAERWASSAISAITLDSTASSRCSTWRGTPAFTRVAQETNLTYDMTQNPSSGRRDGMK